MRHNRLLKFPCSWRADDDVFWVLLTKTRLRLCRPVAINKYFHSIFMCDMTKNCSNLLMLLLCNSSNTQCQIRNKAYQFHSIRLLLLSVTFPLAVKLKARLTFGVPFLLGLVTIQADDKAALLTDPVDVKERRFACVAHLPHAPHRSLPRQLG